MYAEIMEINCPLKGGKKLVNLLNQRGVINNYEQLSSAFDNSDNLRAYIQDNCKQDFMSVLLSGGDLEEHLQFSEFMGIIFPNNSVAIDSEVFDDAEGISANLDDEEFIINIELLKFGFAF